MVCVSSLIPGSGETAERCRDGKLVARPVPVSGVSFLGPFSCLLDKGGGLWKRVHAGLWSGGVLCSSLRLSCVLSVRGWKTSEALQTLCGRCQAGPAGRSSNASLDELLFSLPFLCGGYKPLSNLKVCPAVSIVKTSGKQERSHIACGGCETVRPCWGASRRYSRGVSVCDF